MNSATNLGFEGFVAWREILGTSKFITIWNLFCPLFWGGTLQKKAQTPFKTRVIWVPGRWFQAIGKIHVELNHFPRLGWKFPPKQNWNPHLDNHGTPKNGSKFSKFHNLEFPCAFRLSSVWCFFTSNPSDSYELGDLTTSRLGVQPVQFKNLQPLGRSLSSKFAVSKFHAPRELEESKSELLGTASLDVENHLWDVYLWFYMILLLSLCYKMLTSQISKKNTKNWGSCCLFLLLQGSVWMINFLFLWSIYPPPT